MKKNIRTSKQVIKALSIGISASMLLSSQGAFAAEGDGVLTNDVNDDNNATVAAPVEEKHSEVDTAQDAEVKASESIKDTDTAVEEAAEAVEELEKLTNDTEDKAVTPIQETVEDISANTAAAGNAVYEVKDDLADAEDAALVKEADIAVMNNAAVSANNVTDSIVGTQDVSGFNEIAEEAKTDISENIEEINEATTIASAKESLDEAEASEKEVTDAYENAKAEYEAAEAAYTAAEADLAKAQQAYTEALNNAKANADDADAKLEAAKAKAALLEEQLKAAEAELQKDAAYDILCQEEAIKKTAEDESVKTTDWNTYNELFYDIMENYYIPEVEKGSNVKVDQFTTFEDQNEYNYCKVTYTDADGNEQTKYYNYALNDDKTGVEIFEKTLTYSYKDANDKVVAYEESEIKDMVASGTAVEFKDEDGKLLYYVVLGNDVTTNDLVTESSTTSADGKVVTSVDIDEDTQKVTVTFADGTVTYTTTANVITKTVETVTDKTEEYASKEEAEKELAEKGLDEGSVTTNDQEKVTSYKATAKYIVYFEDTEDFDHRYISKDTAREKQAYYGNAANAYYYYYTDEQKEGKFDESGDHEFSEHLGIVFCDDFELSETISNVKRDGRKVSGKVTVQYAKVENFREDYATFWDGIEDLVGGKNKEKIEKAVKAKVESDGGIYVGPADFDWNLETATFYYVPANSITKTIQCDNEADAIKAIEAEAQKEAANSKDGKKTGQATNINATATPSSYLYWIEYSGTKTDVTTNNEVVKTVEQSGTGLEETYLSNANYKAGNYMDELTDTEFRSWLSDAQGKKTAYENLKSELTKAQAALNQAVTDVETLQNEIEKLLRAKDDLNSDGILDELKSSLDTAKEKLTGAKDDYEEVKDLAEEAREAYQEAVERLTPPAEEDEDDDDTPVTTETTPIATVVTATPAAAPAAVRTVAAAPTEEEATIVEEETPLAETVEEEKTAEPEKVDEAVVIDDSETPLAPAVDEEAMSWWWILIVLALGTTGAELYRRHQVKKNAAKVEEDK